MSCVRRGRPSSDAATPPMTTAGTLAADRLAVSASRAASNDAGTALDTRGSPNHAPPFSQRRDFAFGLMADREKRTRSEEGLELSRPLSNGRRSPFGGFVPGQRSPARDVGARLFRCDQRHQRIITRERLARG
jgi:hypothetical protein